MKEVVSVAQETRYIVSVFLLQKGVQVRVLFICAGWLLVASASFGQGSVREIPSAALNDVMMASFDAFGPVIYYNPQVCNSLDPSLVRFFRAHEYGHIQLNHLRREYFESNSFNRAWIRQNYEREADSYAARALANTDPAAVWMAIFFFERVQGPGQPDWYHPTGYERAQLIRTVAGKLNSDFR